VAVKATFVIAPTGKLTLADEQRPPLLAPEYRGEPATSSLRFDSDLLARKPTTDVVLDACAHAPQGRAEPTVPVRLRIGVIEKTLLVHGTRVYYKGAFGLTTSKPRPFLSRPICYEHAFGGVDTSHPDPRKHRLDMRNPVGKGFTLNPSRLEEQEAHAIEYPNAKPEKAGPTGFGPIASFWSPRLERGGTYDAAWEKRKKPLLPDDYDDRYALCSPDDQRPPPPAPARRRVGHAGQPDPPRCSALRVTQDSSHLPDSLCPAPGRSCCHLGHGAHRDGADESDHGVARIIACPQSRRRLPR
jgi:hypothetical protein